MHSETFPTKVIIAYGNVSLLVAAKTFLTLSKILKVNIHSDLALSSVKLSFIDFMSITLFVFFKKY